MQWREWKELMLGLAERLDVTPSTLGEMRVIDVLVALFKTRSEEDVPADEEQEIFRSFRPRNYCVHCGSFLTKAGHCRFANCSGKRA